MTDLGWLDAAIRSHSERCLDARDLEGYRGALIAEANADERVAPELATRSSLTSLEP